MNIRRIVRAVRRVSQNKIYLKHLRKPIAEHVFLLEAGQGKHINGNIFAFLREIETNDAFGEYIPYLAIESDIRQDVEKKLARYSFQKARLLIRDSKEYKKILATAKYLITDNSFPYYFFKRKEQVYLNTWHGTPLKQLGRADIANSTSIGNVQKNFLTADYLLFPNSYTKNIMMKDYMIGRLYTGKTVLIDYPRNDVLFDAGIRERIRDRYALHGKRVFAYMPTWRGTGRSANMAKQIGDADAILTALEKKLGKDEVVFVNFHFLIGDRIDYSKYRKIRKFPSEYETYDFLGACDTLITDYSSVMFDFAQTGRDVIMFTYDYEEYKREKGFYFDIRELPFQMVDTMDQLVAAIHAPRRGYTLDEQYRGNHAGTATIRMLELLCMDKSEELSVERQETSQQTTVIHVGNLNLEHHRYLVEKLAASLSDEEKCRTVLTFDSKINGITSEFLKSLDEKIEFVRILPGRLKRFSDYIIIKCNVNFGWFAERAERFYRREYQRIFSAMEVKDIQLLMTNVIENQYIISASGARWKTYHKLPPYFYHRQNILFCRHPRIREQVEGRYNRTVAYDSNYGAEIWDQQLQCKGIVADLSRLRYQVDDDRLQIRGKLRIASLDEPVAGVGKIRIGPAEYDFSMQNINRDSSGSVFYLRCDMTVIIATEEINYWKIHNDVQVLVDVYGREFVVPMLSPRPRWRFKKLLYMVDRFDNVCHFKEGIRYYRITIRDRNVTDSRRERIKLFLALLCHGLTFWYRPVVLYEKNSSRYEESASVLLEKLVDCGYDNVRYILDRQYPYRDEIPEKYRNYIVDRFSFRHYYYIFAAKSLISSEAVAHALEPRSVSWLFRRFVQNGSKNYVFLQHGVMYMVSLSAEQRKFFQKPKGKGAHKIVVSSELEAEHFMDYTNYKPEDIYISGLPKFDKSVLDDDADRITVMLTWRPWDYVEGLLDMKNTGYYRLLNRIIDQVPEEMKEKLIVLPHPLVAEQIGQQQDRSIWQYFPENMKYDDILKKTRLLITDYSSISYDAFYRGANVIFCWEEKEACMKQYGANAKLMLTDELAFGEVCYRTDELQQYIRRSYQRQQRQQDQDHFRQIVTFHDGKNTERLIRWIKEDGIL